MKRDVAVRVYAVNGCTMRERNFNSSWLKFYNTFLIAINNVINVAVYRFCVR